MIKKIIVAVGCSVSLLISGVVIPEIKPLSAETIVQQDSVAPAPEKITSEKTSQTETARVELSREQSVQRATPLVLGLVGAPSSTLKAVGKQLEHDLGYSGQCKVSLRAFDTVHTKETMQKLFKEGFLLAVFVLEQDKRSYEVRLYDTARATMLFGKKFSFVGDGARIWGHLIADALWPALTGQPGIFSTKIAYCKKVNKKNAKIKHVYICDYDGSNEERIVETPTVNIAPRWNRDTQHPLLFYSDYTNENVRLMVVNMHKQRKIVSSFDGINMVPSFSSDGKSVVYCASRGKGSCQLVMVQDGKLRQLTNNTGNNVSPSISRDDKKVYFCSDYETGLPQICTYNLSDGTIERITDGGYCASPACCAHHNKVAYAKIVSGVMQLMIYDPAKKTHTQVTFGPGNKEECSWSPCGTYLLYSQDEGGRGSIVSLNLQTKQTKTLTSARDICSYPAWSPVYEHIPVLVAPVKSAKAS